MCGRFFLATPAEAIARLFGLDRVRPEDLSAAAGGLPPEAGARFNICPTELIPVVREIGRNGARARELVPMRWGLIPYWADDPSIGNRTPPLINARSETAATSSAFQHALQRRRCLIPADGFYEWKKIAPKTKRVMAIRSADRAPLALAGLWERWLPPEHRPGSSNDDAGPTTAPPPHPPTLPPHDRPKPWVHTVTILTCPPNALLEDIHDRMPVILEPHEWDRWLDPAQHEAAAVAPLLDPYPSEKLTVHPVAKLGEDPGFPGPANATAEMRDEASEPGGTLWG
ncbi:MAG: SOS response-associated peptidase [Phycisphaerales bacterium]